MNRPGIVIIGAGKVGSALAILLTKKGYPVVGVASRSKSSAIKLAQKLKCPSFNDVVQAAQNGELVFITTPDREIASISKKIAEGGGFRSGQIVAHTSGAHASDELVGVREAGAFALSLHPLQSFADVDGALKNIPGSYFALEGDAQAVDLGKKIVRQLKGESFIIKAEHKPLYHAAACIASNYLVSLMHFATSLYQSFGVSKNEAFKALQPLVKGTISNIERVGPVDALTGPVVRGDGLTIEGHLNVLEKQGGQESELYRKLGIYTINVAIEKGSIDNEKGKHLLELFKGEYNYEK